MNNIETPVFKYFAPQKLYRPEYEPFPCPFMDRNSELCCNDDQIEILANNFKELDSVFGVDCPICSLNLKIMWCHYTCNPKQANFVTGIAPGY